MFHSNWLLKTFFFCSLSCGKKKFLSRLRDRYTEEFERGENCKLAGKGEMTGKSVLHYKAGGPWQWGTRRERKCASAYSLWIIQLYNYPRLFSRSRSDALGGSLNSMFHRFSRRNEIPPPPVVTWFYSVMRPFCDKTRWTMGIWKYDLAKE